MNTLGLLFLLLAGGGDAQPIRTAFGGASFAFEAEGALPASGMSLAHGMSRETETASEEWEWIPERTLRWDREGSLYFGLDSFGPGTRSRLGSSEETENAWRGPREPAGAWQSAVPSFQAVMIRKFMEPLELLCKLQNVRASYEKGISDLSIGTSLPDWVDATGLSLGSHSVFTINFDMLGFEEADPEHRIILDDRHATARLSYLATSLGIRLKF